MPHRRGATGHRQPSRSSSATRLGPNLQFTQSQHKGETSSRGAQQPAARLSSAQRIASREHVSAYSGKQQRSQPPSRKSSQLTTNKSKAGFTLSQGSHSDEESSNSSSEVDDTRIYDENEAEDDDEWVSSESGAQTPNSNDGSEASERERKDREMDRRRDEALKRLLSSGEVPPPPAAGVGAGRQAQQQGSGPVTAKPPPVVDDATAATPQPRNHLSQPPKHQHQHHQEVHPRAANVTRVDTARPEELKSRASSAAARDRTPASAGNQMAPPPVPAAALARAQTTNGSASTQAPSGAAQTQQHSARSNGAPGSKLTIQTTAPTPPSNARSPAPTSQPPSQGNSHPNSPRPRESSRRQPSSRPSSGYNSRHSSGDVSQHSHGHGHHQHQQPLRPHPLIRGHSFGLGPSGSGRSTPVSAGLAGALDSAPLTPKHAPLPSQLQPLTVIQDSAGMLSGSPEDDRSGFGRHTHYISSSPTGSVKTVLTSPGSPDRPRGSGGPGGRRTSVSSVHSSMTMPIQSSTWSLSGGGSGSGQDRKRTTSTLSHSSSTAALSQLVSSGLSSSTTLNPNSAYPTALSSLSHLPSVTRPPSPQAISFFPPMNTQVKNEIEGIHPLLPPPYIGNHLAVLARRNPVWESWERVGRARREMRSY